MNTQKVNQDSVDAQALGIAVKLTLQGQNQFWHVETYYCILVRFKGQHCIPWGSRDPAEILHRIGVIRMRHNARPQQALRQASMMTHVISGVVHHTSGCHWRHQRAPLFLYDTQQQGRWGCSAAAARKTAV